MIFVEKVPPVSQSDRQSGDENKCFGRVRKAVVSGRYETDNVPLKVINKNYNERHATPEVNLIDAFGLLHVQFSSGLIRSWLHNPLALLQTTVNKAVSDLSSLNTWWVWIDKLFPVADLIVCD